MITLTLGEESKTLAVTSDIEPEMKKYTFTKDEISTKEDFILSDDGKVLEWYVGDAKKIVIPDGVEVLEAGWFDGDLYNAQVLIIPDSVTELSGNGWCRHMPHLEAVYIGDGDGSPRLCVPRKLYAAVCSSVGKHQSNRQPGVPKVFVAVVHLYPRQCGDFQHQQL